ncbi:MAG: hypothetical protein ACRES1_10730, partial [Steroidobacteraceae bacterium]
MKTVTKTIRESIRNPRLGLCVGLALSLAAPLALEGAVLWLALDAQFHIGTAALAALAGAGLACLMGGTLTAASLRRDAV